MTTGDKGKLFIFFFVPFLTLFLLGKIVCSLCFYLSLSQNKFMILINSFVLFVLIVVEAFSFLIFQLH